MANTMDYKSFREAILRDFDNNLSGLEIELSKILSDKLGDVKLNPAQLRGANKEALQVAARDVKGDEVDKISLTDFIDDDPKKLADKLKVSSKEVSQYIEDIKDYIKKGSSKEIVDEYRKAGLQSAQEFLGAYRTAMARGQIEKMNLGIDKSELSKIEKGIIETGIVTKQTVSNINGYLANIGVNVNSEKITDKIKLLSDQDIQKLFDAVNLQFDSSGMVKSFQSIINQANAARSAIANVAKAYGDGTPFAENFAAANQRVSDSFGNIGNIDDAVSKINSYADKLGEATGKLNEVGDSANVGGGNVADNIIPQDLDKKVTEINFLIERIQTLYHSLDKGQINEDMRYREIFDTQEVQRLITLLSQLSDAELQTLNIAQHYDAGGEGFRGSIQGIVEAVRVAKNEINSFYNEGTNHGYEQADLRDSALYSYLEDLMRAGLQVNETFRSSLMPTFQEFLSLINTKTDIPLENWNTQDIKPYFDAIVQDGKSAIGVFEQLKSDMGLIPDNSSTVVSGEDKKREAINGTTEAYHKEAEAKKEAEIPSGTGESASRVKHETEVLRENTSERQRNTEEKAKGQQITGDVNADRVEEAQTDQVRQHTAAQEQLNEEMREGQQIQQEAATKPAADKGEYTELTQQLKEVMNLVLALNTVIKRNRSTIGESANEQAKAFKGLYDALDQVNQKLIEINGNKISIDLGGLKGSDGNNPVEALNNLLKMGANPSELSAKFTQLSKAVGDFAEELRQLPSLDNSNFLSSINNLIANGDKLANLATLIKAKQSDIDKVAQVVEAKPVSGFEEKRASAIKKVEDALEKERKALEQLNQEYADFEARNGDLSEMAQLQTASWVRRNNIKNLTTELDTLKNVSPNAEAALLPKSADYSNALKYAKDYWEIKLKGNNATQEELTKLKVIEAEWDLLNNKVGEVTAKLDAQGRSTKAISDFSAMYASNAEAGLQQYIKQETGVADPYKYLSERILPYDNKYTSKVIEQATDLQAIFEKSHIKSLIDKGAVNEISDAIQQLKTLKQIASSMDGKQIKPIRISGLIDDISKYKATFSGLGTDTVKELNDYLKQLQVGLDKGMSVEKFNEISSAINGVKTRAREAGEETKSFWSKLGEQVDHTNAKMIAMYFSFYRIIGYIRQMTGAVIELDSALTELRKITGESTERMEQSFKTSAVTAKELGSTIDAVISQTSDWSRFNKIDPLYGNI